MSFLNNLLGLVLYYFKLSLHLCVFLSTKCIQALNKPANVSPTQSLYVLIGLFKTCYPPHKRTSNGNTNQLLLVFLEIK